MNKSVGIIGCGWVGQALAQDLLEDNFNVIGTTTQLSKLPLLSSKGITAKVLCLPCVTATDSLSLQQHEVFQQDILIIAITPGFKKGDKLYPEKIAQLVDAANESNTQCVILLSSTGIYSDLYGNVDETSKLNLNHEKVNLLNQAEQKVLGFKGNAFVLRLAGLIGPNRHPGRFLASKRNLANPNSAVHLIHQKDVVGILKTIINQHVESLSDNKNNLKSVREIFNCVSQFSSTREKFYCEAARQLHIDEPTFVQHENEANDKYINGDKVRDILSYQFYYDDLLDALSIEE